MLGFADKDVRLLNQRIRDRQAEPSLGACLLIPATG